MAKYTDESNITFNNALALSWKTASALTNADGATIAAGTSGAMVTYNASHNFHLGSLISNNKLVTGTTFVYGAAGLQLKVNKGGVGIKGMATNEEDFVEHLININTHDYVLFFTNKGKVYRMKGYEVPLFSRQSKGLPIINLLPLEKDENISSIVELDVNDDITKYLMFATKGGIVKRTEIGEFDNIRKGGKIAIVLKEDDELISVRKTCGKNEIAIGASNGRMVRFDENEVRIMGRSSSGVKAIDFDDINNVVGGLYDYNPNTGKIVGFCIGTQDAFFTNGTDTVNIDFVENELINISFVYQHSLKQLYIYINGVITGVIKSSIDDGTSFFIDNTDFIFDSRYCDIDLYKLRVYQTDLNVNQIITNFAVDRKDIDLFDQRALAQENLSLKEYQLSYDSMLDYNEKHPNAPLMPYIIFDTGNEDSRLPYSKDDTKNISVEFVNTPLELAYTSGRLEQLARDDGLIS